MTFRVLLAGVALWPALLFARELPRPPLVIRSVTVIDVAHGERLGLRTVSIIAGRIAAIEEPAKAAPPPGAVELDGRDLFLIPGLVDMHVHLFNNSSHRPPNEWAFPLFLGRGITGVREMATKPEQLATVARWRQDVERGELLAPRILAAGVPVDAETPTAAQGRVRTARARGADFIKIFSQVSPAAWRAILDAARAVGLPVCGHVPVKVGLLEAARAGQRSDEHLTQVYEACAPQERQLLAARSDLASAEAVRLRDQQERAVLDSFSPKLCARIAAQLAATRQVQVPTLVLPHAEAATPRRDFREDRRWSSLRSDEQARWVRILEEPAEDRALAAKRWEVSQRIVRLLHAAKVPILAGTDAPMPLVYPGSSLLEELELLGGCGFTPAEALRAATLGPAEFLGLADETGAVVVGQRADLLLLAADPLKRIENLRQLRAVVLAGRLLPAN